MLKFIKERFWFHFQHRETICFEKNNFRNMFIEVLIQFLASRFPFKVVLNADKKQETDSPDALFSSI